MKYRIEYIYEGEYLCYYRLLRRRGIFWLTVMNKVHFRGEIVIYLNYRGIKESEVPIKLIDR